MSKKILVLFPGKRYSCDLPLLYFANLVYRPLGFDVLNLTYPSVEFTGNPDEKVYRKIEHAVLSQVKGADIDSYDEAVFISKSMGTVAAGWLEGQIQTPVRHIYLTPLEETFPYMKGKKNITAVVQGTADHWLDPKVLKKFCEQEGLHLVRFKDVGHRLEKEGDIDQSIRNFRAVVKIYREDAKR